MLKVLWDRKATPETLNDKFLKILVTFEKVEVKNSRDHIFIDNIIDELRISSVSQSNLLALSLEKTPRILWILLLFLSAILIGSFVFLPFESQVLATGIITAMSAAVGLVVVLIFDMDTPFRAGFWNISSKPYLKLKEFMKAAR